MVGEPDDPGRRALLRRGSALGLGLLAVGSVGVGLAGCSIDAPWDRAPVNTVPVAEPSILTTTDWGARAPRRPAQVRRRRPNLVVIHHTTDPNVDDVSREHAVEVAQSIQRFHMDTRGWSDTGQHMTVSRGGLILEGRTGSLDASRQGDRFVVGAHAFGANGESVGIENEGTYHQAEMPPDQWRSLVALTAWLCERHRVGVDGIVGHRDVTETTCPGDWLYSQLDRLRSEVEAVLTG